MWFGGPSHAMTAIPQTEFDGLKCADYTSRLGVGRVTAPPETFVCGGRTLCSLGDRCLRLCRVWMVAGSLYEQRANHAPTRKPLLRLVSRR